MLASKENCSSGNCTKSALIILGGEHLCLDHFFAKCYERLDSLESLVRRGFLDAAERHRIRNLLDECATRTLFVCLRNTPDTNLDRSRLLEILLQCGDLQSMLRSPVCSPTTKDFLSLSRSSHRPRPQKEEREQAKRKSTGGPENMA